MRGPGAYLDSLMVACGLCGLVEARWKCERDTCMYVVFVILHAMSDENIKGTFFKGGMEKSCEAIRPIYKGKSS
jgi:hypothetical protein